MGGGANDLCQYNPLSCFLSTERTKRPIFLIPSFASESTSISGFQTVLYTQGRPFDQARQKPVLRLLKKRRSGPPPKQACGECSPPAVTNKRNRRPVVDPCGCGQSSKQAVAYAVMRATNRIRSQRRKRLGWLIIDGDRRSEPVDRWHGARRLPASLYCDGSPHNCGLCELWNSSVWRCRAATRSPQDGAGSQRGSLARVFSVDRLPDSSRVEPGDVGHVCLTRYALEFRASLPGRVTVLTECRCPVP